MSELYRYEKTQRRAALTLLLNMGVLFSIYLAARFFLKPSEASEQLIYWMNIALPLVEFGLFATAIFFWINNGTFSIAVDADRFAIVDPMSTKASFSVPVSEIVEIRQTHQKHANYNSIMMHMKSGEKIQVSQNYHYDRGRLYAALAEANPAIRLPQHTFRFKLV